MIVNILEMNDLTNTSTFKHKKERKRSFYIVRTYNSVLHVARHEITLVSSVGCPSRGSPVPTRGTAGHRLRFQLVSVV